MTGGNYDRAALANYEDWARQSGSFEALAVRVPAGMSLSGAGGAAHVEAALTSANLFSVMGTQPLAGRVFSNAECQPGRDEVAVLNYGFWQRHFGGDAAVIGREMELDGREYKIIGIMPKNLQYPPANDVFLPLAPTAVAAANRGEHKYFVVGRLRDGVTPETGAGGDGDHCRAAGEAVSGDEPGPDGKGGAAAGQHQRQPDAAVFPADDGRDDFCAAGGVRQCGQPAVCARRGATAGDRHAYGAGSEPLAGDAATADRRIWCWAWRARRRGC